jgi:hypothetical protein
VFDTISTRLGRVLAAAAATIGCLLLAAVPAHSAPNKPFTVAFSEGAPDVSGPDAMPAGMTLPLTMTITSVASQQTLGSANVTLPAGYVASNLSVDRGDVSTLPSGQLALRNLNALPNVPVNLSMTLRLPCTSGPGSWTVQAKQSNDFNGTGNDLTQPKPAPSTTVINACKLIFTGQPAGATISTPIRTVAFDPTSAAVSVRAVDGRASGAQVLDWFTGPISMARSDGGAVAGGTATNAVAGEASFPALQITSAGFFRLRPSTTAAGFATAEASAQFPITDQKADCKPNQCTDSIGNTTLTGTTTQNGLLLLSDNVAPEPTCTGYKPPSATWYDFLVTVPATKTIRTEYTKTEMKGFKGDLQVCFAVPIGGLFASPFDYDNDGTPEGSVGLLPDCPLQPTSPCVTNRGNVPGGGAFIEFFAPASLGDPRYH